MHTHTSLILIDENDGLLDISVPTTKMSERFLTVLNRQFDSREQLSCGVKCTGLVIVTRK